jgi:hypothetical protein
MSRAEVRRQMRIFGWRGAKAHRRSRVDPAVLIALREEVLRRLAEEAEATE